MDAVYVPFLVDDPAAFLKIARFLRIDGFSVTLPYKSAVIPLLTETVEPVKKMGACNTVVRRGRSFTGYNTDGQGFIEPLYSYFPSERLKNIRATVIGAGGAARAAVYALKAAGVAMLILNRTPKKAEDLAREVGAQSGPLDAAGLERIKDYDDLIVQTTQAGMPPHTEQDPLEGYRFKGTELVYDLIYTPRLTRLLQRAMECGCKVLNGEEMLMAQAHEQFRLFTGMESTFRNKFITDFDGPAF
jgi:3-dehydroquinate dehydratase/shikimate dehydrogenase